MTPSVHCARVLFGVLGVVCAVGAAAADPLPQIRTADAEDQLLVVSTRSYPCRLGLTLDYDAVRAKVLNCDGSPCHRIPLRTEVPFANVWIFVHGNQISPCDAIRRGLIVYRKLRRCSQVQGPVRFVIWSWPSERRSRRLKDARQKAVRTDVESLLLGSYLAQASDDGPISLIGYSFGARIITGAVHAVSGGGVRGYGLAELPEEPAQIRVALLAAAVESNALLPRGRHGYALHSIDRLLLMNNSRDRALHFFWVMDPKRKPTALGNVGLPVGRGHHQIAQYDWAATIGYDHSLMQYLNRSQIIGRVTRHISWVE